MENEGKKMLLNATSKKNSNLLFEERGLFPTCPLLIACRYVLHYCLEKMQSLQTHLIHISNILKIQNDESS